MDFFTLLCCRNCNVCLKRPKIKEKEAKDGPFLKTARPPFRMVEKRGHEFDSLSQIKERLTFFPTEFQLSEGVSSCLTTRNKIMNEKENETTRKGIKYFIQSFFKPQYSGGFSAVVFPLGTPVFATAVWLDWMLHHMADPYIVVIGGDNSQTRSPWGVQVKQMTRICLHLIAPPSAPNFLGKEG